MKKNIRKIGSIVLGMLVFLYSGAAFAASGTPRQVLAARESVVYIETSCDEGLFSGSGFAIGDTSPVEYIVTNHHVIEGTNAVLTVYSGNYTPANATVAVDLPSSDLCVLKLDEPFHNMKPLSLYTGDEAKLTGERVFALGFPGSAIDLFSFGSSVSEDVTVTDGIVSAVRTLPYTKPVQALQINVAIHEGNSGGPLLNDNGMVIGVNAFGSWDDVNMNGAICISELLDALEQKDIPYHAGSDWLLPGTVILVILAAAAVAIVFFFLRKRKRKQARKLSGISLADYAVQNGGALSFDSAVFTLLPVWQRLAAMEKRGTACLCAYPQNIVVQQETGRAFLILKFDCRRVAGYSAPEQYKQQGQPAAQADVYQAGALLYRLLIGTALPDAISRYEDDSEVQAAIASLPLSNKRKEILYRAISLNPVNRFPDVDAMMAAMGVSGIPPIKPSVSGLHSTGASPHRKKPKKRMRKKAKIILTVLLCVLLALAAFITYYAISVDNRNNAVTWLEQYNFTEAKKILDMVPDFAGENTPELKTLAEAGIAYENGDYETALALFESLGEFSYAQQMAEKVRLEMHFGEAADLIKNGDLSEGQDAFTELRKNALPEEKNVINYVQAMAYYEGGYSIMALNLFEHLGDYEDAAQMCKTIRLEEAAKCVEEKEYPEAFYQLEPCREDSDVKKMLDALIPLIYEQGVEYFDAGKSAAKEYFEAAGNYGDSEKYLKLMTTKDVFELLPYLGNTFVDERVYSHAMMKKYLRGSWRGDGYYFNYDPDGNSLSYNVPWIDFGQYVNFQDGLMYCVSESSGKRECFAFDFIGANTMDIYSYKSGQVYRMTRQ